MSGSHDKFGTKRDAEEDELDLMLDAALSKYSAAQPRAGLENRILANLHDAEQPMSHLWRQWGLAVALTAVVITAIALAWRTDRTTHPPIANQPAAIEQIRRPASPPATASKRPAEKTLTGAARSVRAIALRKSPPRDQTVAQADPKLDVFPSPQPMSQEELALAEYVRNFPTDAKRVAQAQAAAEQEVLAKMQTLANESTESN